MVEGGGERVGGDVGGGGMNLVLRRGGFYFEGYGLWRWVDSVRLGLGRRLVAFWAWVRMIPVL